MARIICRYPGCRRPIPSGTRFCQEHEGKKPHHYQQYMKPKKVASYHQLYNSRKWKAYSRSFRQENPFCVCCGDPSQVVDHIKPHRGDETLFWSSANHWPLCKRCHDIKTMRIDRQNVPMPTDHILETIRAYI